MLRYKWIFDSNITPSWDGTPEIHNSGFYLRASLAFFMAEIISTCLLAKSQTKQFYYTCLYSSHDFKCHSCYFPKTM